MNINRRYSRRVRTTKLTDRLADNTENYMPKKTYNKPTSAKLKRRKPVQCSALLAAFDVKLIALEAEYDALNGLIETHVDNHELAQRRAIVLHIIDKMRVARHEAANAPDQRPGAKT